jgi:DNA-binding Lrp family transcriptional regulator
MKGGAMVTAMVLINTDRYKVNEVAEKLAEVKGITEVYSVAGAYDLIAVIRVTTNEELSEVVTSRIVKIEGIAKTETLIAFRAYSRHDLEGMFSVGFQ